MAERTVLVVGLPGAGKTTFLAALWSILRQSRRAAPSLQLDRVDGNQAYLNEIRDAWSRCEALGRTLPAAEQRAEMHLKCPDDALITLVFPDLSGETFNEQWERAQCSRDYLDLARAADGVLLFVHPDNIDNAPTITQVAQAAVAAGGDVTQEGRNEPAPWTHQMVGTQVRLVELLQILGRPPIGRDHVRTAVIVSAWDSVRANATPDDELTPDGWLINALPLLGQFLAANVDMFPSRVYGVSAQGGDLVRDRERLLALGADTWRRIIVEGPECERHDITAPIRWLIGVGVKR